MGDACLPALQLQAARWPPYQQSIDRRACAASAWHAVQLPTGCTHRSLLTTQALATDPNFIRLSKGAYSLHCFHADKEQLVRVAPPKEPKSGKKAAGAADGGEAAAAAAGGEGSATPAAGAAKKEKEAVPMQRVEAKSWEVGGKDCLHGIPCVACMLSKLRPWVSLLGRLQHVCTVAVNGSTHCLGLHSSAHSVPRVAAPVAWLQRVRPRTACLAYGLQSGLCPAGGGEAVPRGHAQGPHGDGAQGGAARGTDCAG